MRLTILLALLALGLGGCIAKLVNENCQNRGFSPGPPRYPARRALAAAVAAAGRVVDALKIAQHRHRIAVGAAQLDDLAEAAAIAAGAAGTLAELAAAEHDRRDRFGGLDRDRAHPGREGGHVEPVLAGARAGAAAMKDDGAEGRQFLVRGAAELVLHIGAAIDLRVPEGGGAFGRDAGR